MWAIVLAIGVMLLLAAAAFWMSRRKKDDSHSQDGDDSEKCAAKLLEIDALTNTIAQVQTKVNQLTTTHTTTQAEIDKLKATLKSKTLTPEEATLLVSPTWYDVAVVATEEAEAARKVVLLVTAQASGSLGLGDLQAIEEACSTAHNKIMNIKMKIIPS